MGAWLAGRPGTRQEVGLLTPDPGRRCGMSASVQRQCCRCSSLGYGPASARDSGRPRRPRRRQTGWARKGLSPQWPGLGLSPSPWGCTGTRATGQVRLGGIPPCFLQLGCVPRELAVSWVNAWKMICGKYSMNSRYHMDLSGQLSCGCPYLQYHSRPNQSILATVSVCPLMVTTPARSHILIVR